MKRSMAEMEVPLPEVLIIIITSIEVIILIDIDIKDSSIGKETTLKAKPVAIRLKNSLQRSALTPQ